MAEWQPIETAPDDKKIIGAWLNAMGEWCAATVTWRCGYRGWVASDGYSREPTRWMPLPDPPKEQNDG